MTLKKNKHDVDLDLEKGTENYNKLKIGEEHKHDF